MACGHGPVLTSDRRAVSPDTGSAGRRLCGPLPPVGHSTRGRQRAACSGRDSGRFSRLAPCATLHHANTYRVYSTLPTPARCFPRLAGANQPGESKSGPDRGGLKTRHSPRAHWPSPRKPTRVALRIPPAPPDARKPRRSPTPRRPLDRSCRALRLVATAFR